MGENVQEAFQSELEQLVKFMLIAIQSVKHEQDKIKKSLLDFIFTKKDVFHALGMGFQMSSSGSIESKWEQIQAQISELDPQQRAVYDQLLMAH